MSATLLVILAAVAAVAFLALGMSLTLIFKGHHIKSEISDNEHLRRQGIKCAVQEAREQQAGYAGTGDCKAVAGDCATHNCAACAPERGK